MVKITPAYRRAACTKKKFETSFIKMNSVIIKWGHNSKMQSLRKMSLMVPCTRIANTLCFIRLEPQTTYFVRSSCEWNGCATCGYGTTGLLCLLWKSVC